MDATTFFPSRWLRADDVNGSDLEAVISKVTEENISDEKRLVVHFDTVDKGLVLNKTNFRILLRALGKDTDHWIGNGVVITTTEVPFRGEPVSAIRIKVKK